MGILLTKVHVHYFNRILKVKMSIVTSIVLVNWVICTCLYVHHIVNMGSKWYVQKEMFEKS